MTTTAPTTTGRVLVVILLAQFIIVVDSTFMNVSISTLVADFDTTVTGIQNAITLYTLVMAAFMIAGAKVGDIIGRKRAFVIGLTIYSVGTTLTAVSPSLAFFMLGWSILEGLGAAVMLPAMMSLIVSNFAAGPARAQAYAGFAAIAGIAAGIGPIIGGLFTTYLSWRLAFASELLVALFIFSQLKIIADAPVVGRKPRFDWAGFLLSAAGLILVVLGIVLASAYGLFTARTDVTVNGQVLLAAGQVSPTVILVCIGLLVLIGFILVERHRYRRHRDTLLDLRLFSIRAVSAGSSVQLLQYLLLTGAIFALSLYVQMELGYSAIQSGVTVLPLSLAVLLSAAISGRLFSRRFAPRSVILAGFGITILGALAMGLLARDATSGAEFIVGLALIGFGVGTIASQNQNLIMSSVEPKRSNETSGVINTSQNIGASLGTSLAGALILSVFVITATSLIDESPAFTQSEQSQLDTAVTEKAQIVSDAQLSDATEQLTDDQQAAVLDINAQARQTSLTVVYAGLAFAGLLGLAAALRLPRTPPLSQRPAEDADA
ncbi:MFS transporter [Cryobacterium sp. 1639]|uniref:MFS transporter n=1 Tax=Cryobacterium inferilacus TaxID=2866629 RepID=UPI001C72B741|nr:MFS transporter [Cryobacterium sp. 1639]MBX0298708.1 MFS transporter [Cryobacterium sp. 1639]